MRTSSIWTCTYAAHNNHGCWSQTWGKAGDHPISALVAKALAEAFLKAHKDGPEDPTDPKVVPKLKHINYLYPYPHCDINEAFPYGENKYHQNPHYVIPPKLQAEKEKAEANRKLYEEEANRIREVLQKAAQDTVL